MQASKSIDKRSRSWVCVVYPESAPENWLSILRDLKLAGFVSPLHDKDINADGTPKKAHYHVMTKDKNKKSYEQMMEIVKQFGGVLDPEPVHNWEAYARYLIHKDNPEKAQYKQDDVISLGGLDYLSEITKVSDKYGIVADMISWINDNMEVHHCNYSVFVTWCKDNNDVWFRALVDHCSYLIDKYLKSMSHMSKDKSLYMYSDKVIIDPKTGEVVES